MGTTYDSLISLQLGKRFIFQRNFGISVQIKVKFCNPVLIETQNLCSLQLSVHKTDICLLIFKLRVLGIEY